jgi:hypothetical protein
VQCSPASGSLFALGSNPVRCSAEDAAGNEATGTFPVTVRDTTAPSLSLPADITAEAPSPAGASVSFTASAQDIVSGAVRVQCAPASGSLCSRGSNTVSCSAQEAAGNDANGTVTVTVRDTTAPGLSLPGDLSADERRSAMLQAIDPALWRNRGESSFFDLPQATPEQKSLLRHVQDLAADRPAPFDPASYPLPADAFEYLEDFNTWTEHLHHVPSKGQTRR